MSEKKKMSLFDKYPIFQKIKSIKHIELILICLFVLILGVVYISSTKTNSASLAASSDEKLENYGQHLEEKLTLVLSKIEGVGAISVMITFDGRITYEYATEKQETTTSSSVTNGTNSKTVVNEEIIIIKKDGQDVPLVVKEIYPDVGGVVVVASGANNVSVRLDIISAIQTLLDISDNKIRVLTGTNK